jgi:hypothetical protein
MSDELEGEARDDETDKGLGVRLISRNRCPCPAGQDVFFPISFIAGNVLSVLLLSDQDMTIKTNSSAMADDTIVLKRGLPLVWNANDASAPRFRNPFFTDVNAFYVTTETTAELTLRILAQE